MSVSKNVIVRYRTLTEAADENSRLVEAVFASLEELKPNGFAYTTHRLADGVSFLHLARLEKAENPLATLPAFAEFQHDLARRCLEPDPNRGDDRRFLHVDRMTPATSLTANELERTPMRSYEATTLIEAPRTRSERLGAARARQGALASPGVSSDTPNATQNTSASGNTHKP
jgi:hypothetical protein